MTVIVRPRPPADDAAYETSAKESFALVARVQAGDREAFGLIFERYHLMILGFVIRRVTSRHLAEDITQDVFVRAFTRMGKVEWQGKDLGAWLYTIARNLVADYYKSSRYTRDSTSADPFDGLPVAAQQSQEPDPEDAALASLTHRDVLAAMGRLTSEQRDVLTLRFLRGLSVAETATAMDKNVGAIKALQYRASMALCRLMNADENVLAA